MKILNATLLVGAVALTLLAGCSSEDEESTTVYVYTYNRPPVAVDLNFQATKGFTGLSMDFAGSDPDGDAVTFMVASHPAVGAVVFQSGTTFNFTAPAGFAGTVAFTYVAHDGKVASAPATVTVTIANDTTADPYLVSEGLWVDNNSNSDTDDGHQGISADGRYVAFTSGAADLLATDANGTANDVFVRDMQTGAIELISKDSSGTQSNSQSRAPLMSDNGRYVLFYSYGSNLVANDTNNTYDIFLHDRSTGSTVRISEGPGGVQANSYSYNYDMSGDGRYIAFTSNASNLDANDTDGTSSVFLLDRTTGTLTYIAPAENSSQMSRRPQVSDDGSMVVFKSSNATLVPGDTNGRSDLFIWRAATGTFTRVNEGPQPSEPDGGGSTAALSADGSKIAFISGATNIWPGGTPEDKPSVYVYDVATATITHRLFTYPWGNSAYGLSVSADGRTVVYKGGAPDGGFRLHVWKFDLVDGTKTLVGPPPGANGGGSYIASSPDARFVAFVSGASNIILGDFNGREETFWVDTHAGPYSIRRVSEIPPSLLPAGANGASTAPACSSDGQFVAYATDANNVTLVRDDEGNRDIVLHDLQTGVSTLVTADALGHAADDDSAGPDVSDSGLLVVFSSQATNIATWPVTVNRDHVYLKNLSTGAVTLLSKDGTGAEGDGGSLFPSIADDGSVVVFASQAANLTADADNNTGGYDIYSYDVSTGVLTLVSRGTGGGTGDGASTMPRVRDNGSNCIFESDATDLMAGDANGVRDIFKVNLTNFNVTRISVGDGSPGAEANGASTAGSMNAASNIVAFLSAATNLTSDTDANATYDVFVRDIPNNTTTLVSVSTTAGQTANGVSYAPCVSPDGNYIVFASDATDLIAGDTNGQTDVFVFDRSTGTVTRVVENASEPVISNNGVWIYYRSLADDNIYRTAR